MQGVTGNGDAKLNEMNQCLTGGMLKDGEGRGEEEGEETESRSVKNTMRKYDGRQKVQRDSSEQTHQTD